MKSDIKPLLESNRPPKTSVTVRDKRSGETYNAWVSRSGVVRLQGSHAPFIAVAYEVVDDE